MSLLMGPTSPLTTVIKKCVLCVFNTIYKVMNLIYFFFLSLSKKNFFFLFFFFFFFFFFRFLFLLFSYKITLFCEYHFSKEIGGQGLMCSFFFFCLSSPNLEVRPNSFSLQRKRNSRNLVTLYCYSKYADSVKLCLTDSYTCQTKRN